MMRVLVAGAVLLFLGGCASPLPPKVEHVITVACYVDNVAVPIAQPIIGSFGPAGATAQSIDTMLVHPAVVAACAQRHGTTMVTVRPENQL